VSIPRRVQRRTDRPIIMRATSVRGLLAGTKTQTRRLLSATFSAAMNRAGNAIVARWPHQKGSGYEVGDRLWVREGWAQVGDNEDDIHACPDLRVHAYYRADSMQPKVLRWRSPIFMPRWASRLTLTVTDVYVQRVQYISDADAVAEGIWDTEFYNATEHKVSAGAPWSLEWLAYADLWNALHGSGAWDANPWIVALSFTVARGNIDALAPGGER
jgi:hypothetical protein